MSIWSDPPQRHQALDRGAIVAAAVAIADESGAAAVTMKAVADRLGGYTPMALYRHVRNKTGLIDLMLDAATAEIPLAPGDWRPALHRLAMATRAMIKRHPWYAELVHTRPPAGPHQMAHLELMLTALTAAGATLAEAMTHAAMITRHIYGSGLQEATEARSEPAEQYTAMTEMRRLAEGDHPNLAAWLAHPSGPSPDDQFELVLGFLLDGIATRLPS
ncbi:MAG: TetR family transcriptional regulator [Actinophytocola sp.]|uniref:TetR/AcrR family transcriptional regulator C-terminal domain-containing protein n=1 Tax=Actinophytocola sp. TaxID=1872138 RepID=UPI0013262F34|nr:TetR/AcrR family transcriptional regulator C-terminal domain-containing protein [Actinophytocola sp.]MPZ79299.1 TetR family transcriptional regulator [Actinophytocola sp.]